MPKKKTAGKPGKKASKAKAKGEELDERMEHFGREVEALGGRMEQKGKKWETFFHRTFGVVGPLISTLFGIIILAVFIWMLYFLNSQTGISFFNDLGYFMSMNIGLFFLILLFFSYSSYFSRISPKVYRIFSPFVVAFSLVIILWIIMSMLNITNNYLEMHLLSAISFWINQSFGVMFVVFLFIGYVVLAVKMVTKPPSGEEKSGREVVMKKASLKGRDSRIRRLYRSGKDRILGGVCGGIAEYLDVDPVIIRLLWVVLTVAALGTGIILYILFWIIIPRNPRHRWED